jgi:DNA-binding NarL/FixJ family response regulator
MTTIDNLVRTVLVCVRTPVAAQTIAICANRLGVASAVRTAVTAVEVLARLAERPADLVLVDSALVRSDPVGFVRRALGYAPGATLVLFGTQDSQVAAAAIAAGARGVIRDGDPVTSVTKTLLLLRQPSRVGSTPPADPPVPDAPVPVDDPATARPAEPIIPAQPAGPIIPAQPAGPIIPAQPAGPIIPAQPAGPIIPAQPESEPDRLTRPELTEREVQVLRGMTEGKSNAEIGRELFVSEDTVKTHARRLYRKLGARDRAHAVASAFRAGLVR